MIEKVVKPFVEANGVMKIIFFVFVVALAVTVVLADGVDSYNKNVARSFAMISLVLSGVAVVGYFTLYLAEEWKTTKLVAESAKRARAEEAEKQKAARQDNFRKEVVKELRHVLYWAWRQSGEIGPEPKDNQYHPSSVVIGDTTIWVEHKEEGQPSRRCWVYVSTPDPRLWVLNGLRFPVEVLNDWNRWVQQVLVSVLYGDKGKEAVKNTVVTRARLQPEPKEKATA